MNIFTDIALVFYANENYRIGFETLSHSIDCNNSKFKKYYKKILLSDDITKTKYADEIINFDQSFYDKLSFDSSAPSRYKYTFSKFELFKIQNYEKLIFFESDIICNNSIEELISGYNQCDIAGAKHMSCNPGWIHPGVMILNSSIYKKNIYNRLIEITKSDLHGGDDGVINQLLSNDKSIKVEHFSSKYNFIHQYNNHLAESSFKDANIIHFLDQKPWKENVKNPSQKIWEKYNKEIIC